MITIAGGGGFCCEQDRLVSHSSQAGENYQHLFNHAGVTRLNLNTSRIKCIIDTPVGLALKWFYLQSYITAQLSLMNILPVHIHLASDHLNNAVVCELSYLYCILIQFYI